MALRLHGDEHIQIAESLYHLGACSYVRARYNEAEERFRQAVAMQRSLLGPDHPDVAATLTYLGDSLCMQDRFAEAKEIQTEALELKRRVLGDRHPDVAESLEYLGGAHFEGGELAEAETLFREVLRMRLQLFGEEHPDVVSSLMVLGQTRVLQGNNAEVSQGHYAEAEALLRRGLAIAMQLPGGKRHAGYCLIWLARALERQGKSPEAEETALRAIPIYEEHYGEQQPGVGEPLLILADIQSRLGKLTSAVQHYRRILAICRREFGESDVRTQITASRLARRLDTTGRVDEAIALQVEMAEHANDWGRGGLALLWAGRHQEHEALCAKMLALAEASDSAAHMDSASRCALMNACLSREPLARAAAIAVRSLELEEKNDLLGQQHRHCCVGMAKYREGKFAEAEESLVRAIEADNLDLRVNARAFLAMAAFRREKLDEARERLAEAEVELGPLAVFPRLPSPFAVSTGRLRAWLAVQEARRLITSDDAPPLTGREQIERGLELKARAVQSRPNDAIQSLELAQLYAWFDRQHAGREVCREALVRACESADPITLDCAAKSHLIRPTGDPELTSLAVAAARKCAELRGNEWDQLVCGMAEYRERNYPEAEHRLTKAQATWRVETRGPALLFRAMTRHAVGTIEEAKADFAAAESLMKPMPDRANLTIDVLNANNVVFWLAYEEAKHQLEGAQSGQEPSP
jgi:tetratricopeptide (TPR) repeat protein